MELFDPRCLELAHVFLDDEVEFLKARNLLPDDFNAEGDAAELARTIQAVIEDWLEEFIDKHAPITSP